MIKSNGLQNGIFQYNFKDLLGEYIEQITTQIPKGEYHLCGWSFGGLSALEISRVLGQSGYSVLSIHLIDTCSPIILKSSN